MIRVKPLIKPIPSKSVVEDVITRPCTTGGPNDVGEYYTPFPGMSELIQKQFNGSQRERFNLRNFLDYCENMDFDPRKTRTKEMEIDGIVYEKESTGFVTLDDFGTDSSYIEKWITYLMIGYKKRDSEYIKNNGRNTVRVLYNEEGEATDERDLLELDQGVSLVNTSEVLAKVPHLLKIIWEHSKKKHVHLISFLIAYEYIINVEHRDYSSVRPEHFADKTTFMLDGKGNIRKAFIHKDDNKGEYYPYGRKWAMGEFPNEPSYKAARELIVLLNEVGFKFYDENPAMFTEDLMNRMICTYIPSNDEYIKTYGKLDPEVANALEPGNIFKIRSELRYAKTEEVLIVRECDRVENITSYINIARTIEDMVDKMLDKDRTDSLLEYIKLLFEYKNGATPVINKNEFSYVKDILCFQNDYFTVPGEFIGPCDEIEQPTCILHRNGLVLVFENDISAVRYTTIDKAISIIKAKKEGRNERGFWYNL